MIFMLVLVSAANAIAAPFQNLDFEQAVIKAASTNFSPWDAYMPIDAAYAVPFWTPREDDTVVTALWGAPVALDETSFALITTNGYPLLQGRYSVLLSAAGFPNPEYFRASSISQVGDVPIGSRSIRYLLRQVFSTTVANPTVSLGGRVIPTFPLCVASNTITMIGDINGFDGKSLELRFECNSVPSENYFFLDAISFSQASLLSIANSITNVEMTWPSSMTNYVLQATSSLVPGGSWSVVTNTVDDGAGTRSVRVDPKAGSQFFRLLGL